MRNLKKVLVLVLCLAMMASIMVTGAAAAFTDAKDIDSKHQEAVDMSVALNIINGYPDGSFQPNGNVTRAEMSKIICIALNGGQEPATSVKPTPTFKDIDGNWAEGFIEYCYAKGIVAGKSADTFDPNGNVTGSEAAKMLLVALGYNADVEKYVGSDWALYVNVQANQDGLYDKLLDIQTADPLSREHAAQMIWNALQSGIVEKDSSIDRNDGSITDNYKKNEFYEMLAKYYKGETQTGIMESFKWNSTDKDWDYQIDGVKYNSSADYTALLGQNVKVVYDTTSSSPYDTYGIFVNKGGVLFSGQIADLPNLKNSDDSFKFDGAKYKFDAGTVANVPVYLFQNFNDYTTNGMKLADVAGQVSGKNVSAYDAYKFDAVDQDGDGSIDFLMVQPFTVAKISFLNSTDVKVQALNNNQPLGIKGTTDKIDLGDVTYYEGMAKDDYVIYTPEAYTSNDTATIAKADVFNGKISMKDDSDITVEGTTYTMDDSYNGKAVGVGDTLADGVTVNGYVFYIDHIGKKSVSDYAVALKITGEQANSMNGNQAKLLFTDGSKKVVDTNKNYVGTIAENTLVTYSINGDGEYKLTEANAVASGYDLAADKDSSPNSVNVTQISNSNKNAGYINGAAINDSTVIFLQYETDKYKVITGAQMMKMKNSDFAGTGAFAERFVIGTKQSGNANAYDANLAFVTVGTQEVKDADTFYGYVLSASEVENSALDTVKQVKMWTPTGEQTFLTSSNDITGYNSIDARAVVEYRLNADNEISEIVNSYAVASTPYTAATSSTDGVATIAATQWAPTVQFKSIDASGLFTVARTTDASGNYFETDSKTQYIYIENTDKTGEESVALSLADDFNDAGALVPNALIVFDDEGTVLLVVYDVDNEITR